jgi:carbonic anhydrase
MESGFNWAPFGPGTPASGAPAPASPIPARRLAIVTCMDARVDPLRALGLRLGDAHVIRNAGALVDDDVLRSLASSRELGGTTAVVIVAHSDCRAHGGDDAVAGAAAREGVDRVRAEFPGLEASGVLYDLASGRVSPL